MDSPYKVDFKSVIGVDDNGRKYMDSDDSITKHVTRRYLDHVETHLIENIEQHQLIVMAQTIYEECQRRGLKLTFFQD